MGMYGQVAPVSEETIRRIHADPPLVLQILQSDDPDAVTRARKKPGGPSLLGRLFGAKPAPPPAPASPLTLAEGEGRIGDLDKAWQAAHYLFTGSAWEGDPPLNFLLEGGSELDYEGPWNSAPRTFTPLETREIAAALAAVSDDELRARFDPAEMMKLEIYPEIWDREPDGNEDPIGYVMSAIADIRETVNGAAQRGWGLLVTVD